MTDCIFCTVPDLICNQTSAYCIGFPAPDQAQKYYNNYHIIESSKLLSKEEFQKMNVFTPGSRLKLTLDEANQLIDHRQAWTHGMNQTTPYIALFESSADIQNPVIKSSLESLKLPKDWDVVKISKTQYVLNKRAVKILIDSTLQFNSPVSELIEYIDILKTFSLDGNLLKKHSR